MITGKKVPELRLEDCLPVEKLLRIIGIALI